MSSKRFKSLTGKNEILNISAQKGSIVSKYEGKETYLMDAGKGTFADGTTESWLTLGTNSNDNVDDSDAINGKALRITYGNRADGAQTYLRESGYNLNTNLTVGNTYMLRIRAKRNAVGACDVAIYDGTGYIEYHALTTSYVWYETTYECNHATNGFINIRAMGAGEIIWIDEWYIVEVEQAPVLTNMEIIRRAELRSMLFDGTDSKIIMDGKVIGTGDVTMVAWVRPYSVGEGGAGRVFSNGTTILSLTSPANKQFFMSSQPGSTWKYSANDAWAPYEWCFVAATRTTAGLGTIYVNGVLNGTAAEATGTPAVGTGDLIVGNGPAGGNTVNGEISGARIYTGILSINEISQIYTSERQKYSQ